MSGLAESDLAGLELCPHGERRKFCARCAPPALSLDVPLLPDVPEALIEAECTKLLEEYGWRALRTDPVSDRGRGKGFGEVGMADHLYIRYDPEKQIPPSLRKPVDNSYAAVLWIEFKSAKGKPKKHQIAWHQKERARGALTLIAGVDFPASVAGFLGWYRASGLQRRGSR